MLVLLGVLEYSDALPVMEHFDQLDTDHSGRLTNDDLSRAREQMEHSEPMQTLLLQFAKTAGMSARTLEAFTRGAEAVAATERGSYVEAAELLEAASTSLADESLSDALLVRSRLKQYIDLAEMKWR